MPLYITIIASKFFMSWYNGVGDVKRISINKKPVISVFSFQQFENLFGPVF